MKYSWIGIATTLALCGGCAPSIDEASVATTTTHGSALTSIDTTCDSWTFRPLGFPADGALITGISVNPSDDNDIVVTTYNGIFRSHLEADQELAWNKTYEGQNTSLRRDPAWPRRLYAISNFGEGCEDPNCVVLSDDGGNSWDQANSLPGKSIRSIQVSTTHPNVLYVGIQLDKDPPARIYRCEVSGNCASLELGIEYQDLIPWDIEQDKVDGALYVGTEKSGVADITEKYWPPLMRSQDGGSSWQNIGGYGSSFDWAVIDFEIQPQTGYIFAKKEALELCLSTDHGATWSSSYAPFYLGIALDPVHPYTVYGAGGLYGTDLGGVYFSRNAGSTFRQVGLTGVRITELETSGNGNKLFAAGNDATGKVELYGVSLPGLFASCSRCILDTRPDILSEYGLGGWDTSCANQGDIADDWCSSNASDCANVKSGFCADSCKTTAIPNAYGITQVKTIPETINGPYDPALFFDGRQEPYALINHVSEPVSVTLSFEAATVISGFQATLGGDPTLPNTYLWTIEAAHSLEALDNSAEQVAFPATSASASVSAPSYQLLASGVPTPAGIGQVVQFPPSSPARFYRIRFERTEYDRMVHIAELQPFIDQVPAEAAIRGVVLAQDGNTLEGSYVQACDWGGRCTVTSTGSDGSYQLVGLAGGFYYVTALPPPGTTYREQRLGPLSVANSSAEHNFSLTRSTPPPEGTSITSAGTTSDGIPIVFWGESLTLRTNGCAGGTASYSALQAGVILRNGSLTEITEGAYTATLEPLTPVHGEAQISITTICPDSSEHIVTFDLYIDPSGSVRTVGGMPLPQAKVEIFRASSRTGPFEPVPYGSALLSA